MAALGHSCDGKVPTQQPGFGLLFAGNSADLTPSPPGWPQPVVRISLASPEIGNVDQANAQMPRSAVALVVR